MPPEKKTIGIKEMCHQESSKELGKCDLGKGIFQREYVCSCDERGEVSYMDAPHLKMINLVND